MSRHTTMSKATACSKVAKSLREFGYPSVGTDDIIQVLDAWLAGKRDHDLPHGVVGMMAQRQFDEIEEAAPGILAKME